MKLMKVHASNRQQNYDDWRWNGNDSLIDQLKEYLQEIGGSFDFKTKMSIIRSLKHLAFPTKQNDSLGWNADTVKQIAKSWATRYDVNEEYFEKIWGEEVLRVEFDCFLKRCKDKNYFNYHQSKIKELPKLNEEHLMVKTKISKDKLLKDNKEDKKKFFTLHEMMHIFSETKEINLFRYQKSKFYKTKNKGELSTSDLHENCKILNHYKSDVYEVASYRKINEFLTENFPMLIKNDKKKTKQFDGSPSSKAVYDIEDLEEFFEHCNNLYEVKEEVLTNKPEMESYWNGIRTYSSLEEIRDSDEWTEEMAIGIPSELRQKINQTNNAEPGDSVLVVNNGDQINLTFLCKKIDYIEKSLCEIKKEIGRMYRVPSKVES